MSPRRTRRGTIIPDINTPSTEKKGKRAAASPKEKSHPPPKRRNTRAAKQKITSDSEDNQSRNVSKKSTRKRPAKSEVDSLITEDESITESPKRERLSSRLENSLISDDESTPRHRPTSRGPLSRVDTTPKSSPISVPLTPHRSKKTPRRSPVDFGSPKTHSDTPLRLSKTPRKLEIDGTPPSEDSQTVKKSAGRAGSKSPSSRTEQKSPSPKKSPKRAMAKKSTKRAATKSKESPSPKKETNEEDSPSRVNKTVSSVTKTSASPKSSRRSMPASKIKKSPVKLRGSPTNRNPSNISKVAVVRIQKLGDSEKSMKSTPMKTPPPSPKRPKSAGKKRLPITDSGTPLRPIPTPKNPKSSLKKLILEKQTKVISPSELKALKDSSGFIASTPREKTRRSLNLSSALNNSTPLIRKKSSTPLVRKKSSSVLRIKSSSPAKMKSPSPIKMKSPSPIKMKSPSPIKMKSPSSIKKKSPSPIKKKSSSLIKKKSPSPIKKKSPNPIKKKSLSPLAKQKSVSPKKKSSSPKIKIRSFMGIDDESDPALSDTSLINMSDVFDSDVSQKEEEKKDKDGTYDLIEPKTPILQAKKSRKRTSTDANLSGIGTESKKVCKVRFADSEVVTNLNVAKMRSGTPGHKLSLKRTSEVRSKSKSPQRFSKGLVESTRRRSSSVSVIEGTPRTPINKRRINSVATSNLKSNSKAQLESVNRLSRPRMSVTSEKKIDSKTPVPRKIPNFAEIHKKSFNKMESIVDAKKRVAERHVAMVNPIVSSSTKSMPEIVLRKQLESSKLPTTSEVGNGAYTRFGFKVRKNEAVESISKKQSTMTSEKKKNARRDILKGVRTNRRFELQMKSRKSLGSQ